MNTPDSRHHLHAVPDMPPSSAAENDLSGLDWINDIPDPDIRGILNAGIVEGGDAEAFMATHKPNNEPNKSAEVRRLGKLTLVKAEDHSPQPPDSSGETV
ncbi:MAG TPA: hypothetical protein VFL85_00630 [Candidatus Saccharimonadales bacterium]|nr:hypothetical protein [Candidatus Saccharimonadales bacterium]